MEEVQNASESSLRDWGGLGFQMVGAIAYASAPIRYESLNGRGGRWAFSKYSLKRLSALQPARVQTSIA